MNEWDCWKVDKDHVRERVAAFTPNRVVFDFDELDAQGLPRCPWPGRAYPWPLTGFVDQVVGPFLRDRDRARRRLVAGALEVINGLNTARYEFDGRESPRLIRAVLEGPTVEPAPFTDDRLEDLAVTAGTRLARNSPEGLAISRATIAASPYQQARRRHGCEHPCAECARTTTPKE